MTERSKGHALALIIMTVATLLLFGNLVFTSGLPFPAHTDCFLPWRSSIPQEQVEQALGKMNRAATDKNFSFHPDNQVTADALQNGRLPLWNPHQMGGVPHLGQSLYGVFYPLNLPIFLFGPDGFYTPTILLHYILAGFFTYLLLKRFGLSFAAAVAGGLFFICCANMTGRFHYYMTIYPVTWAPLMLILIDKFHKDRSYLCLSGLAVLSATIVLAGFQQMALYILYLCMGYSLFLSGVNKLQYRWRFGISIGLLLTAAGLAVIPFGWNGYSVWTVSALFVPLGILISSKGFIKWIISSLPVGCALCLGVALSAIQMAPAIALMPQSTRQLISIMSMVNENSLSTGGLLGFLSPLFLCDPIWALSDSVRNYAGASMAGWLGPAGPVFPNYVEWSLYIGVLPLALLACAITVTKEIKGKVLFLIFTSILFLLMAFGVWMIVFPTYFIGFIFDPRRTLLIFSFIVSLLAAISLNNIVEMKTKSTRPIIIGAILIVIAVLSGLTGGFFSTSIASSLHETVEADLNLSSSLQESKFFIFENSMQIKSALLHLALAAALGGAGLIRLALKPGLTALLIVFSAFLVDMIPVSWHVNQPQEKEGFLREDPAIACMKPNDNEGKNRIFRYVKDHGASSLRIPLPGNISTHFNLEDGEGYIVQPLKRYALLMNMMQPGIASGVWVLPISKEESIKSPILDLIGVKYLIATDPLPNGCSFNEIYSKNNLRVFQNSEAFPRAFLVKKWEFVELQDYKAVLSRIASSEINLKDTVILEGAPIDVKVSKTPTPLTQVRYITPEEVEVTFNGPAPGGFLVLTDAYYPGWKAEVDGNEVNVFPADCAFRAVAVPEGAEKVIFRFDPPELKTGTIISLVSGILLIGLFIMGMIFKPK